MNRTPEQLRAIGARGRVMVSASAGAGKTSVMIERLAEPGLVFVVFGLYLRKIITHTVLLECLLYGGNS